MKEKKNSELFYICYHSERVEVVGSGDLVMLREVDGLMRSVFVDHTIGDLDISKHYEM